ATNRSVIRRRTGDLVLIHGATLVTNARPERRSDRLPRLQFSAGATHCQSASHRNRAAPAR
ncbi:MAG: hypothetical protein KDE46_16755, partial [Caldilineaceae bacterium]|nr:hypothetical protein [Caldilineaceae bacterium]